MKFSIFTKVRTHIVILLMLISPVAMAQIKIDGTVTDSKDKAPIPGVSIFLKSDQGSGTITDFKGNFSFEVPSQEEVLIIKAVGYNTQELRVGNQRNINVLLMPSVQELEELIVVGYGVQKKKEITGAVASLKTDEILKTPTSDLGESLQGQIAGVNIQQSSGRPGASANVQIRGLLSATNAGSPLYIVDGIPFNRDPNIAPEQIESIDVLKDGAAAAIYGTRGAAGVILITTKRGKEGKMKVDFTAYGGVQNITSGTPLMGTNDQLYVDNVRLKADGNDPLYFTFDPDLLQHDNNYVDDVLNNNAAMQSYNLNVSGGSEQLKFNVSTNYFKQDGVMINSGFERFSTRMNGEFKQNRFRAFASLGITNETREQEPWGIYEYAIAQKPWTPAYSSLPKVGGNGIFVPSDNALRFGWMARQLNNSDEREVFQTNLALTLEYELMDGLKISTNLGRNTYAYDRTYFQPQFLVYNESGLVTAGSNIDAKLDKNYINNTGLTLENVLNYNKTFGKHNVGFTAVYSMEQYNYEEINFGVVGLLANSTPTIGAGLEGTLPTGFEHVQALTGKLLRAQYGYDNRYLASFSFRRDGSSNFSESNRYGNFLGGSVGWNISEENFFKNASGLSFITNFKLRASYAQVGNQAIQPYSFIQVLESGSDYPFGPEGKENLINGVIQRRFANPDIKWETTHSRNIGIDLSLFEDKLTFSADYYENDKSDMLLPQTLPPSSGTWPNNAHSLYNSLTVNAGNMVNKGIELQMGYRKQFENGLQMNLTGTFTRNRNKVTFLNGIDGFAVSGGRPVLTRGANVDPTTFLIVGREAGSFFLLENEGVIKTQEQLDDYNERIEGANARMGDIMYRDQNGDGMIDDNDRVYAGSGQADFDMGMGINLNYKRFDFFTQLFYSQGASIYNGAKLHAYSLGRHADQVYMWTPQNNTSDIPMARNGQEHSNTRARSDYFLEDGTYLRIRNISLGYTIPSKAFNHHIGSMRIYVTTQNPFTFTKYTGFDPEVGGDGLFTRGVDSGNYPITRKFLMGLQLNF